MFQYITSGQHRFHNKKRPSWEKMQHFVWFVFCFCSRGFSSFHPSFQFQQFWFCVLFSFANIAEQWEPCKKKKGLEVIPRFATLRPAPWSQKKKAWAPSPYCVTQYLRTICCTKDAIRQRMFFPIAKSQRKHSDSCDCRRRPRNHWSRPMDFGKPRGRIWVGFFLGVGGLQERPGLVG